jgi:flagellar basal-body rod modification protein FlgD
MTNVTGTTTATTSTSATAPTNPQASLGKDDFLKLLTTQLQHQDPMNPVDDKDFMGQMAQFSALEQTTNMAEALDKLSSSTQFSQGVGLLGRSVDWADDTAKTSGSGSVDGVSLVDGKVVASVDGQSIPVADITGVR